MFTLFLMGGKSSLQEASLLVAFCTYQTDDKDIPCHANARTIYGIYKVIKTSLCTWRL